MGQYMCRVPPATQDEIMQSIQSVEQQIQASEAELERIAAALTETQARAPSDASAPTALSVKLRLDNLTSQRTGQQALLEMHYRRLAALQASVLEEAHAAEDATMVLTKRYRHRAAPARSSDTAPAPTSSPPPPARKSDP